MFSFEGYVEIQILICSNFSRFVPISNVGLSPVNLNHSIIQEPFLEKCNPRKCFPEHHVRGSQRKIQTFDLGNKY